MNKKILSRRDDYEEYVKGLPKDYCPFCDFNKQIILGESEFWYWIANISPYWKYHTLFIPKRHIQSLREVTSEEFSDYKYLYNKVLDHLLALNLKHQDGKPLDQFITMVRERIENVPSSLAEYYKPLHLHIHLAPDREGVERFVLDETSININIEEIKFDT